jgi:hypothetical protein
MKKQTILKHGDPVIVEGRRGLARSVIGYAFEHGDNVTEALRRADEFGHEHFWVNKNADYLCSNADVYKREDDLYRHAPRLEDGDIVMIEGTICAVRFKGDFCDMANLEPI